MKRMREIAIRFWQDERGQSTTEYILILAAAVLIALRFKEKIGSKIESITEKLGTKIESQVNDL